MASSRRRTCCARGWMGTGACAAAQPVAARRMNAALAGIASASGCMGISLHQDAGCVPPPGHVLLYAESTDGAIRKAEAVAREIIADRIAGSGYSGSGS